MDHPKISIVTAVYNQVTYLEETIQSVISQNYPNLEYIIIDGGSTDGTVDIIKKYEQHLAYWVSEKDNGLYHALQKGFYKCTGEIMGWLGSDDLLHRKSLFLLAAIFTDVPEINWLQGRPTFYNEVGMTVATFNPISSPLDGYLKRYRHSAFIQQESTYWRRSLWEKAGSRIADEYKLAGDFELWMRFFLYDKLYVTHALIGGFRFRKGQLSNVHFDKYLNECDKVIADISKNNPAPQNLKKIQFIEKYLFKSRVLKVLSKRYHHKLYTLNNTVHFNYDTGKFQL